jgi:chitinase
MVAFVENWKTCPTDDEIKGYTKVIVSFAVSYVWNAVKNQCDKTCKINSHLPLCTGASTVASWKAAGVSVLVSFGGAGMGGSWDTKDDCWEYCFGKVDYVVDQLETIVNSNDFDGVDIDYEYHHTEKSSTFLEDLTTKLKARLGNKIVSHAPMEPDIAKDAPYYKVLKKVAASVDYVLPQYYNGHLRPANGMTKTLAHMHNLVDDIFSGDASKVIFGFCISDCAATGSNVNSAQAVAVMKEVNQEFPDNGGAYIWAASRNPKLTWSGPVAAELGL